MTEEDAHTMLVLLWICVGAAGLGFLILMRVLGRLARLERLLHQSDSRRETANAAPAPSPAETSAGGAFETFLAEDDARRIMPKKEQFAAYRKWRQENGLNWSAGDDVRKDGERDL